MPGPAQHRMPNDAPLPWGRANLSTSRSPPSSSLNSTMTTRQSPPLTVPLFPALPANVLQGRVACLAFCKLQKSACLPAPPAREKQSS